MRIFDLVGDDGRPYAFEVRNTFLGRRGALRVVCSIPGVRVLREPGALSWFRDEAFVEFEIGGVLFRVWEPFGDNSRYWIGPEPARPLPELAAVRAAFARAGLFGRVRRAAA